MIAQTQPTTERRADPAVADRPVDVPQPRAAIAPTATVTPASLAGLTAPASPARAEDDVEIVAARIVSSAAAVTWVGRLALLLALGLVAAFVLLP